VEVGTGLELVVPKVVSAVWVQAAAVCVQAAAESDPAGPLPPVQKALPFSVHVLYPNQEVLERKKACALPILL
jgi:hypothetical protein